MASSYNELFGLGTHSEDASLEGDWPCQDDAASTVVDDASSNAIDGVLTGGDDTEDLSVTGPNNYLTKALSLDATNDYVLKTGFTDLVDNWTVGIWINPTAGFGSFDAAITNGKTGGDRKYKYTIQDNGSGKWRANIGDDTVQNVATGDAIVTGTLIHLVASYDKVNLRLYEDGTQTASTASTLTTYTTGDLHIAGSVTEDLSVNTFLGTYAGSFVFSRTLTAAEIAQIKNGPEEINSVAPAVTGTETEGQTLTTTTGTWALDSPFASGSNGSPSYAKQWTRSDDNSGTNEADIAGATNLTYVLQAADVTKFIRCRLASSNDGGNDSAADTNSNFTGAIAASSGTVVVVGLATETDSALTLSIAKAKTLDLVTEVDTALQILITKLKEVNQAIEVDTALSVLITKLKLVGLSVETDSSLGLDHSKTIQIGISLETETALPITGVSIVNLGIAIESDLSFVVQPQKVYSIGVASENDLSLAISKVIKAKTVGIAIEIDSALGFTIKPESAGPDYSLPHSRSDYSLPYSKSEYGLHNTKSHYKIP